MHLCFHFRDVFLCVCPVCFLLCLSVLFVLLCLVCLGFEGLRLEGFALERYIAGQVPEILQYCRIAKKNKLIFVKKAKEEQSPIKIQVEFSLVLDSGKCTCLRLPER